MSRGTGSPKGAGPEGIDLAYDPDMDAAETRKIRREYRDVLATQAGMELIVSDVVLSLSLRASPYLALLKETRANLSAYKVSDLITDLGKVDTIFSGGVWSLSGPIRRVYIDCAWQSDAPKKLR